MRIVPDYLYIGTSKAGSTWLFRALKWHPQIYAYPGKNLGFFSTRFENGWDWYHWVAGYVRNQKMNEFYL